MLKHFDLLTVRSHVPIRLPRQNKVRSSFPAVALRQNTSDSIFPIQTTDQALRIQTGQWQSKYLNHRHKGTTCRGRWVCAQSPGIFVWNARVGHARCTGQLNGRSPRRKSGYRAARSRGTDVDHVKSPCSCRWSCQQSGESAHRDPEVSLPRAGTYLCVAETWSAHQARARVDTRTTHGGLAADNALFLGCYPRHANKLLV